MAKRRTIDVQNGDDAWVSKFTDDISSVCGMIEEAFQISPTILLSPVMRKLIRDKARELESKLQTVRGRICVDNPSSPLCGKGE